MADSVQRFYDGLSDGYHLLFADWDASVRRQGEVLDRLIQRELGRGPDPSQEASAVSVLDCSCGIGTQAIGLAGCGYRVHGTDLSPAAVARAAREAARLGVPLTTGVADLRALDTVPGTFDVVLSCDNALPHLLTDDDLALAARGMYARLRQGGLLIISLRDYDRLLAERPRAELPRVFDRPEGRQIAFQVWDWHPEAPTYTLHQFIVWEGLTPGAQEASDVGWQTHHEATIYRALQRRDLTAILQQTGFREPRWHEPDETGYYQPIITAQK
ncbi:MAG: class I SAM-dependent methyltransferase [Chloroflexota bacterium]